ncbi:MAG: hypothetical protein PHO53_01970 [Actinomycetota bacterium]|nr:hypothetical protein [Actinomycetota bacterium]
MFYLAKRASLSEEGFTIIEALAGILIFLVAMVGVTAVFESGGQSIVQSRSATEAEALGSDMIEGISHLPFYREYTAEVGNQDIDDFYYNAAKTNPQQLANPGFQMGYGEIEDHPNCRMRVACQYQKVGADGVLATPPAMKEGWGPKVVGNDEPVDVTEERLRLILVRVEVTYKIRGGEKTITLDQMISDSKVEFSPRIDSVSPNGFQLTASFDLTVTGGGFDNSPEHPKPTVKITKTGFTDIDVTSKINTSQSDAEKLLIENVVISQDHGTSDIYWDLKVQNADGIASVLKNCLYQIVNPPFITQVIPETGTAGVTWVKIVGYDFGSKNPYNPASDYVSFQGTPATDYNNPDVTGNPDWYNNYIWAKVPTGATSGFVWVHKEGFGDSNKVPFTVGGGGGAPWIDYIENVMPGKSGASGSVGDKVRIYGVGFGDDQPAKRPATDSVRFYDNKNSIVYPVWSDVMIECTVPIGATTGDVVVRNEGVSSNEFDFVIPYEEGH